MYYYVKDILTWRCLKNYTLNVRSTVDPVFFSSDSHGNEYDLSRLTRNADDSPWIAIDASSKASTRQFYINVCKPLPPVDGCLGM